MISGVQYTYAAYTRGMRSEPLFGQRIKCVYRNSQFIYVLKESIHADLVLTFDQVFVFSHAEKRLAKVGVVQIQDFVVVHGAKNFVQD